MTELPSARQHALVIGGSMAGLLAARVLAEHFARVTIIDRDVFPEQPIPRAGVPQGKQVHILLMRGQRIIEKYLPGFRQRLADRGAHILDFTDSMRTYLSGEWFPNYASAITMYACSRPLLEFVTREMVSERMNITTIMGQEVVGLQATADGKTITGVRLRARDGQAPTTNPVTELAADLIVDASGRHSKAPEWLQTLGYPTPAVSIIDPHLGYATGVYRLNADRAINLKPIYGIPQPPSTLHGAVLIPLEGNREWIVTLIGTGGKYPPTDQAAFLEFARLLPFPELYAAIHDAEAVTPISGYRDTANQLRHYEQMARRPEGLLLVGDAVAAFDPVYGQGMSVAAMDAECLDAALRRWGKRPLRGFAHHFQRAVAKQFATPWLLAATPDLLTPGVEGQSPTLQTQLSNSYLTRLMRVLPRHQALHLTFVKVAHLIAPPTALFAPGAAMRTVLLGGKRRKR